VTRAPISRRSSTLSSSLGLGEKLFASSEERHFAAVIEQGLEEVEAALLREVTFADAFADVTTRYLLQAGGKRVRPTLTLLTAQLGDGATPDVLIAAQAVEITHLASLYHDDVMDEAQLRRGVPSAQNVWGNSVAILAGDLLFARASGLIASLGERALSIQSNTFERLVLGQLHETVGPRDGDDPIAHYLQVLADKTGSLIALAALVGVIFSYFSNPADEVPIGAASVAAFLMVGTISGILLATLMNNGGGAWDNAKKYIETGAFGGKGSDAHKASVVGDTVGDPFKDTAGPSIHVLIKLLSTITLVAAPLFL